MVSSRAGKKKTVSLDLILMVFLPNGHKQSTLKSRTLDQRLDLIVSM